ncbi:hypothetical protein FHX44_117811 [Pseudonocardia hierapolitana]|uniref:Uncharacterized protein n=1 Tax=Pseudonocardia hierapolitana TaxID=1128676 RepID=A0A561T428_9PSEU|nr:hypothetical protein [Pseudonocardia hierapolitana]TWF81866.1 hypothetical protein FHX44_117811 [Pseudonocardia hierapolitana]
MARTRSRGSARSGRSGRTNKAHALTPAIEFFTQPERHLAWRVLGFLVRARAEIIIATTLLVVFVQLQAWVTPTPEDETTVPPTAPVTGGEPPWLEPPHLALLIMLGGFMVLLVIPASRRFLIRRVWCVITRHRMRACFVQSRTMTLDGRMPFLLWSRPSPVGERVRVWLPAGLSVKDIEDDGDRLAAACWAHEVRVTPTRHQAALVVVDVIRRDPLATRTVLRPAVLDDLDGDDTPTRNGATAPLPDRSTLQPNAPAEFPTVQAARNGNGTNGLGPRNTSKTPATTAAGSASDSEPPVTGFGGVDVSDYV